MLQDKKRSTIQFLCSRSQHFQLVHHLPIFFNSHPELPMKNSLPTDVNCSNKNRASPIIGPFSATGPLVRLNRLQAVYSNKTTLALKGEISKHLKATEEEIWEL